MYDPPRMHAWCSRGRASALSFCRLFVLGAADAVADLAGPCLFGRETTVVAEDETATTLAAGERCNMFSCFSLGELAA